MTGEVSGVIYTWRDLRSRNLALSVLRRIHQEGPDFAFDKMGQEEPIKLEFGVKEAATLWTSNAALWDSDKVIYGILMAKKNQRPRSTFSVSWQEKPSRLWLNAIHISVDEEFAESAGNRQRLIRLLSDLFTDLDCGYGNIRHRREWEEKGWVDEVSPSGAVYRTSIGLKAQDGLEDIYWANFFGPPYVRLFKEQRIATCPTHKVKALGKESYLLLTDESPFEWSNPEVLGLCEAAKEHLNMGVFLDKREPGKPTKSPDWIQ